MPFYENYGINVARFGKGDIAVVIAQNDGAKPYFDSLALIQLPKELGIGAIDDKIEIKNNIMDNDTRTLLTFDSAASIDIMIHQLMQLKRQMMDYFDIKCPHCFTQIIGSIQKGEDIAEEKCPACMNDYKLERP